MPTGQHSGDQVAGFPVSRAIDPSGRGCGVPMDRWLRTGPADPTAERGREFEHADEERLRAEHERDARLRAEVAWGAYRAEFDRLRGGTEG